MYEIIIPTSTKNLDDLIEKLQIVDIYNVYYEAPFVVTTDNNGYGFYEKDDEIVNLKVIVESDRNSDCDSTMELIKNTLNISNDLIFNKLQNNNWQQSFEPIYLHNNWIIAEPTYSVSKDMNKINFESQGAFGTGLHETTQDCLRFILNKDFTNRSVLDIGTGSGILSIAASLKNAKEILALDIRDVKEEVSYNAKLNDLSNIDIIEGNLLSEDFALNKTFDDIFINIGGEETLLMLNSINALIKPNGKLLVSGMVEWSYDKISQTIIKNGYKLINQSTNNEWVTALFVRMLN